MAPLAAQDSTLRRPATPEEFRSESPTRGPTFFMDTAADGRRVDARDAAVLERHVSVTLIGVPLAPAVEAIAKQARLEATVSADLIPPGARVSMKADDVTVAAALTWVLANAGLDVLVGGDGHLTLVPHADVGAQADSSGVLTGALMDITSGEPVAYATVALLGTDRARFAGANGHFRLTKLMPRAYKLRARQIGYEPVDTTVVVSRAPSVATLTLRMRRIPAFLGLVKVEGHRSKGCVATGVPDSTLNPTLAAVFAQVRENVDRNRLLLDAYPFRYTREEQRVIRRDPGGDSTEYVDTVSYDSRAHRPYREGAVIYNQRDTLFLRTDPTLECLSLRRAGQSCGKEDSTTPRIKHAEVTPISVYLTYQDRLKYRTSRRMYLPVFRDLADSTFLAAHCFALGGTERDKKGPALLRIDFQPATRIRTPDVEGSIYLDAQRLIVRRAVFEMTRPGDADPPVIGFRVTSTFRELAPLVPLIDSVQSEQPLPASHSAVDRGNAVDRVALSTDHLLGFAFENATPGVESLPPAPLRVNRGPRSARDGSAAPE